MTKTMEPETKTVCNHVQASKWFAAVIQFNRRKKNNGFCCVSIWRNKLLMQKHSYTCQFNITHVGDLVWLQQSTFLHGTTFYLVLSDRENTLIIWSNLQNLFLLVCVCVCVCVRACVRACVCAHVCVCACVRACACACVCARATSLHCTYTNYTTCLIQIHKKTEISQIDAG
jgi:hypothetical protein